MYGEKPHHQYSSPKKKPSLHCKETFFMSQTRLVYTARKPCLQHGKTFLENAHGKTLPTTARLAREKACRAGARADTFQLQTKLCHGVDKVQFICG